MPTSSPKLYKCYSDIPTSLPEILPGKTQPVLMLRENVEFPAINVTFSWEILNDFFT